MLQSDTLKLRPWQLPPCTAKQDDPNERDKEAQALRKMLAAGLSRYEPDPLAALGKVRKR